MRVFAPTHFGFHRIQVERPLPEPVEGSTGRGAKPKPDKSLTDYENVPLSEDIHEYLAREVLP